MGKLDGRVAVITAAGSGMGRATARLFAEEGAKVVVADIAPDKGEETVGLIKKDGGEASFVQVDVAKVADMERMIKETVKTYGELNILYNHAGMAGPYFLEGVTEKEWHETLDVNLKGGWFATQFAVPEMRKAGGGSILFTASVGGMKGASFGPVYSIAKGGVIQMTRSLALLLAKDNIRVNAICPSLIDTPMAPDFVSVPGADVEAYIKLVADKTALKRLGRPEEVAYAALFLVSDEASFITGVFLPVDGGYMA